MRKLSQVVLLIVLVCQVSCGGGGGGGDGSGDSLPSEAMIREEIFSLPGVPVDLEFAEDGRIFIAELDTGNIRTATVSTLRPEPLIRLPSSGVAGTGLLGITLDPQFSNNGFLYAAYTGAGEENVNVVRIKSEGDAATVDKFITQDIPYGGHIGGKLIFGRDEKLYITTGDVGQPGLAQQIGSFAGKVLRFERDGSIPADNPFPESPVFAFGFRNVFGIALQPGSGALFVADNGPDCDDEVNRVSSGGNFGWKDAYQCGFALPGETGPVYNLTPSVGITALRFYRGAMFPELQDELLVADFVTGSIRRLRVSGNTVVGEAFLLEGDGTSILDIEIAPDGSIYFTTLSAVNRLRRR